MLAVPAVIGLVLVPFELESWGRRRAGPVEGGVLGDRTARLAAAQTTTASQEAKGEEEGEAERPPPVPRRKRPPATGRSSAATSADEAPPVPRRKTKPSAMGVDPRAAAAAGGGERGGTRPSVPRRKTRPATAAGWDGRVSDGEGTRGRGPETAGGSERPHGAPEGTTLRKGPTQAQCLAESPSARRLLEHERFLAEGGAAGTLSAELRAVEAAAREVKQAKQAEQAAAAGGGAGPKKVKRRMRRQAAAEEQEEEEEEEEASLPRRYVDGVDVEASRNRAAVKPPSDLPPIDHAQIPSYEEFERVSGQRGGWRGYDLPEVLPDGSPRFPDGTPAPYEEGYGGQYGLDDGATMEESLAAYRDALARYDAIHGPPREAAEDEAYLKEQRRLGWGFKPLYQRTRMATTCTRMRTRRGRHSWRRRGHCRTGSSARILAAARATRTRTAAA